MVGMLPMNARMPPTAIAPTPTHPNQSGKAGWKQAQATAIRATPVVASNGLFISCSRVVVDWYLYSIFRIKSQATDMQIPILGVPISLDSKAKVLEKIGNFLREDRFHRIATVNPEFLVLASRDNRFRENLLSADLRVADGFGMVLAGLLQGEEVPRFPGADLLLDILSIAEKDEYSVFLAIRQDGLSSYEEIQSTLLKKYPKLFVSGTDSELGSIGNWKLEIGNSAIVFCNYGAPMQELFLARLQEAGIKSRLAIGVGGSFDYLTGKQKRAPQWLRAIGFEWLWRLILQPKRWRRIWNAVVVFPVKVLLKK